MSDNKAQFNFYLNRQGVTGKQGAKGEKGFSPVISVERDTLSEYILRITNESSYFLTTNLRESKEDRGGTYIRYDRDQGVMYAGDADRANKTQYGEVRFATPEELAAGDESTVITPADLEDATANMVTTNTDQTITGNKSFSAPIKTKTIESIDGTRLLSLSEGEVSLGTPANISSPLVSNVKVKGHSINIAGKNFTFTDLLNSPKITYTVLHSGNLKNYIQAGENITIDETSDGLTINSTGGGQVPEDVALKSADQTFTGHNYFNGQVNFNGTVQFTNQQIEIPKLHSSNKITGVNISLESAGQSYKFPCEKGTISLSATSGDDAGTTAGLYITGAGIDNKRLLTEGDIYTLPQANATAIGGVKANPKTDEDTQAVNIDPATGLLYTKAGDSGGTEDYTQLTNKPQINGIELAGNKNGDDLGLQNKLTIGPGLSLTNNEISIDTQAYKGIVYSNNDTSFGELNYSTGVYNQKTAIQYPSTKDELAVVAFDGNIDNITSFDYMTVVKVTDVSNRNGVVMFAGNAATNYVSIDCWNGYGLRAVCTLDGSSTQTEEGIITAQNTFAALRLQHTGTTLNVFTYISPNGELPANDEDWALKFTREWDLSQNPISGNNLYLFVLGGSLFFDQTLKTTNTIGGTYYLNQTKLTINNTNVFNKLSDSNAVIASEDKLGLVKIDNNTIVLNNNAQLQANIPNNIVTTDTTQTITGQKEFTKTILSLNVDLIRGQQSETYRNGAGLSMGGNTVGVDGGPFAPQWNMYSATGAVERTETIITSYNQSTLNATNFNTANKLVRLDDSGKLPAIDGSQLTNLPATAPDNMVTTENFSTVAPTGNLKYWTGTEAAYTELTSKDADTLYRTTDTNKVFLGTIQIGGNA